MSIIPYSTVEVNSTVLMSCTMKGFPTPSYTWYKSDVIMDKITSDIMTIKAAAKEDAGIYKCVVKNIISQKESNKLTVNIWGNYSQIMGLNCFSFTGYCLHAVTGHLFDNHESLLNRIWTFISYTVLYTH